MPIVIGESIPSVIIKTLDRHGFREVDTFDLFRDRRGVMFGVPGAFTPTCSTKHLPGYRDHARELAAAGVAVVACLAVNDAFVLDAWAKEYGVGDRLVMLADGNGELTRALGLEFDATGFGMGWRCERFSMLIDDGVVRRLNIEPPGQYGVSSAEHMLDLVRQGPVRQENVPDLSVRPKANTMDSM